MNTKSYYRSIVLTLFAIGLLIFAVSLSPENAQAVSSLSVVQLASTETNVTVGGIVYNMVTSSPMPGVTVKLYFDHFGGSPNYTTISDANGSFSFSSIPSGTYAINPLPPTGYVGWGMMITVGSINIDNLLLPLTKSIQLLSPANNAIVEGPKPLLCWEAMPQAVSYRLALNRKSDWLLIANPQVSSSCYQVTETLEDNVTYSWQLVNALNAQGQVIGDSSFFSFTYKTGPVSQFADVPSTYWAYSWIDRLYSAGITSGCGTNPLIYCPEDSVTRAQMAIFLERGMNGSTFTPPAGTGIVFTDVPLSYWAVNWIEKLYADGITSGCGTNPLIYCPESPVTRSQMAVFLLRAKYSDAYIPPAVGNSTGFNDVLVTQWAAAWIKQLAAEGITSGCGSGNYCPDDSVTRAQMAVFLVRTFNLP
jgi:uncharacterized protein YoaH (UPF0181 family)